MYDCTTTDPPFFRASITPHSLTLNRWRPGLITGGPSTGSLRTLRRRRVVLADLTKLDDGELLVSFVPSDSGRPWARERVLEWATTVGYRRVWLDDRVIDLDGLAQSGPAAVRCPTCGMCWEDQGPDFWETVRDNGWFPGPCLACGGSLPEWAPEPAAR